MILSDFGIAKIVNLSAPTASGPMVGTPAYMAPEQGMGLVGDERADIYSLGAVTYQLVTGRLPFDADTFMGTVLKHITEPLTPPSQINPHLLLRIEATILRAMEKDPDERYRTARDFAVDVRKSLAETRAGQVAVSVDTIRMAAPRNDRKEAQQPALETAPPLPGPAVPPPAAGQTRAPSRSRRHRGFLTLGAVFLLLLISVIAARAIGAVDQLAAGLVVPARTVPAATGSDVAAQTRGVETPTPVSVPVAGPSMSSDSPTALGGHTTFGATVTAGTDVRFFWSCGDGDAETGPVVTHQYSHTGIFTAVVTATTATGSVSTTVQVVVLLPIDRLEAVNDGPTPCGRVTTLRAAVSQGTDANYEWNFGDGETAKGAIAVHTYAAPGTYTAMVTATKALHEVTATTTSAITDMPIKGLRARAVGPKLLGGVIELGASLASGTNARYGWDLGDGSTGSGQIVTHTYPTMGTFTAIVAATNSASEVTRTTVITITPSCLAWLNGTPYPSVQAAADASTSAGDEVKVAGQCSGVSLQGDEWPLLYLARPLTVRGGDSAEFSTWDPAPCPSALDAQGQRRVVSMNGDFTATLEGLYLINGASEKGKGAGIRAIQAHPIIGGCVIHSNIITGPGLLDGYGGAVYLSGASGARLINNLICSNTAQFNGGGLMVADSVGLEMVGSRILSNIALFADGGGSYLHRCRSAILRDNTVSGNRAGRSGGGASVGEAHRLELVSNRFVENQAYGTDLAHGGGGIYLLGGSGIVLVLNEMVGKRSQGDGAGMWLGTGGEATLTNNVVADNQLLAGRNGAGLYDFDTDLVIVHNTFARNAGGGGQGFYALGPLTAAFTKTLVAGQAVGIQLGELSYAYLNGTLWGTGAWANGSDVKAAAESHINRGSIDLSGLPDFIDPDAGDYPIGPSSDAIDRGLETEVATDIGGEARIGAPDIGADEHQVCFVRLNDEPEDYGSVQAAVDASTSADDVVKVAGRCAGTTTRNEMQQTVYLSKTLTIRGGVAPADWSRSDPTRPAVLDARGERRVLTVIGEAAPTLERLTLVGGNTPESGGGMYVVTATVGVVDCRVMSNTAGSSGGLAVVHARLTMTNSVLADNTASALEGAGVSVVDSDVRLQHATIARNRGGSGVFVTSGGSSNSTTGTLLELTDAIVVGHSVGIRVTGRSKVAVDTVFWDVGTTVTVATVLTTTLTVLTRLWGIQPSRPTAST